MLPRSSDLELVINFKTAKTIGVDVPTPLPCTSFAAVQCLLLALSGHNDTSGICPLSKQSGHALSARGDGQRCY